jgi:serine phosphatase RsbU (regulator of sigma subunit)
VRGFSPRLRVDDPDLTIATRYIPGTRGEVLGGDFLDAVELADGTVRLVTGHVSGHGPDGAAVGVNLRSYDLHANAYVSTPVDFDAFARIVTDRRLLPHVVRLPTRR